jgi:hypothetical protein
MYDVKPLLLETLAGSRRWKVHWDNLKVIEQQMEEVRDHALQIRTAIAKAFQEQRQRTQRPVQ